MNIWFWFWVLAAAILLLAETLSRELLYAPFAAGSGAAGYLEWAGSPVGWQWIAFLAVSFVLSVVLRRKYVALTAESCPAASAGSEADAEETRLEEEPEPPSVPADDEYRNVPRRSRRLHRRGR